MPVDCFSMVGLALRLPAFHSVFQDFFPEISCKVQMVARVLSLHDKHLCFLIQHFCRKRKHRIHIAINDNKDILHFGGNLGNLPGILFYPLTERRTTQTQGKEKGPGT